MMKQNYFIIILAKVNHKSFTITKNILVKVKFVNVMIAIVT